MPTPQIPDLDRTHFKDKGKFLHHVSINKTDTTGIEDEVNMVLGKYVFMVELRIFEIMVGTSSAEGLVNSFELK